MAQMINLLDFDSAAMTAFFAARGEKPFRAKQTLRWVHHRLADRAAVLSCAGRALGRRAAQIWSGAGDRRAQRQDQGRVRALDVIGLAEHRLFRSSRSQFQ